MIQLFLDLQREQALDEGRIQQRTAPVGFDRRPPRRYSAMARSKHSSARSYRPCRRAIRP